MFWAFSINIVGIMSDLRLRGLTERQGDERLRGRERGRLQGESD